MSIFKNEKENELALNEEMRYLGKYYPYHDGQNPDFDWFSGYILDVKDQKLSAINYFISLLISRLSYDEEFVICVMPDHKQGTGSSGIRTIAEKLCSSPLIDGTNVITRSEEIEKKATGGSRNIKSEINSIAINDEGIINEKKILLLDDVTTSGTSLLAGKHILKKAGAKLVVMLALAKTD